VVLVEGPALALVSSADTTIDPAKSLAGDPADRVTFDGVAPIAVAPVNPPLGHQAVMMMGGLVRSMQIAGALETMLDLVVEYAGQRVAFGRPISKFQAIQQSIATMACEVAAASTGAPSAVAALEDAGVLFPDDDALFLEITAAKVRCAEAAANASRIAHQVHGAIGVSAEHVLHRFTLRSLAWRDDFGDETYWAVELGRRVSALGSESLWPLLASR
jgi:acyl-CoA dehydrogenase